MKRRMTLALVLAMSLSAAFAMAEETNSLKDFTSRLKGGTVQTQTAEPETPAAQSEDESSYGKPVKIEDPFFQKVRSSAYLLEDKYSREANVMIEVKNVSGRTLYPRGATVSALNAAGEVVEEESYSNCFADATNARMYARAYVLPQSYSNCAPDMVEDGESMFIWDWFYGFETPIDEIAGFAVTVESETSTYTEYQKIDAQGMMMDSVAYALVENTLDTDIYGVSAVIAVDDDEGRLLDVCRVSTGNATGIFPGSTMILRATVRDYENDTTLESGNATVYALHELD